MKRICLFPFFFIPTGGNIFPKNKRAGNKRKEVLTLKKSTKSALNNNKLGLKTAKIRLTAKQNKWRQLYWLFTAKTRGTSTGKTAGAVSTGGFLTCKKRGSNLISWKPGTPLRAGKIMGDILARNTGNGS